ncbi:hypothetical protein EUGRSUZ_F03267 [Eucalyptus grandis]|uniref:Uncharacterized protein n=2 Tax=Eucalyptus grandis TaxID=71139 RepID=A0ACC3KLP0_EUCGR|nr:hypothetical protein EUGRSUZ_F03267 [Eucalyptus grandis]
MDPFFEQRLREEVVYLHSLWHRGPPPNPPLSNHSSSRPIPISNPTPFKKQYSAPTKKKKKHQKDKTSEEPKQPEKEWPCKEEPITQPSLAWPTVKQKQPDSGQKSRYASAEKQAKIAGQLICFFIIYIYFEGNMIRLLYICWVKSDGDDEEENDDDDDVDDLLDGDANGECEVIKFLMKLFMETAELRSYNESVYKDVDFCCLVCGGVGNKPWKWFKGCNGLLQHCTTTWKIKKLAKKAYARAICKVLNWDINCFPPIKNTSEAFGRCLVQSGDMQDSVSTPASSIKWHGESPVDRAGTATSEWSFLSLHQILGITRFWLRKKENPKPGIKRSLKLAKLFSIAHLVQIVTVMWRLMTK